MDQKPAYPHFVRRRLIPALTAIGFLLAFWAVLPPKYFLISTMGMLAFLYFLETALHAHYNRQLPTMTDPTMSDHIHDQGSLNKLALSATVHCLTGCSIGEVIGMVIGSAAGLANALTIGLSVVLAFVFGYLLTMLPLLRSGIGLTASLKLALASDTVSIVIMEIVDNAVMLVIPGAMEAGLDQFRFWGSLTLSLVVGGAAAFPVVRFLIARGRGHALVHQHRTETPRSQEHHH